jgi:hypothetical protein
VEYLIVEYPTSRRVVIDGEELGRTDVHYFEIEAGKHVVTLAAPFNFKPPQHTIVLKGTNQLSPRRIRFEPL